MKAGESILRWHPAPWSLRAEREYVRVGDDNDERQDGQCSQARFGHPPEPGETPQDRNGEADNDDENVIHDGLSGIGWWGAAPTQEGAGRHWRGFSAPPGAGGRRAFAPPHGSRPWGGVAGRSSQLRPAVVTGSARFARS